MVVARPITCGQSARGPVPLELSPLSRRQAALDLTLLLVVALLIPIGFQLTASLVISGAYELSFNWVIVIHKWFEALLLVSLAAYFVYRHGLPAAGFGLQADRLAAGDRDARLAVSAAGRGPAPAHPVPEAAAA